MFSNGTEWDAWNAAWCETCVHDTSGPEDGCWIILALILGEKPDEVGPGPCYSPQTVAYCTKYKPRTRPKYRALNGGDAEPELDISISSYAKEADDGEAMWNDGGDA